MMICDSGLRFWATMYSKPLHNQTFDKSY